MSRTVAEVAARKRWLRLALPDDFAQCRRIAEWVETTEHRRAVLFEFLLAELRHQCWDRRPTRAPKKPHLLRPSKQRRASGYRRDHSKRK